MKLRQISFKIISLVMVFTMLFSISATTISAVSMTEGEHTHGNEKEEMHYVSLGDSMTNGYGLPGYEEWNDSKNDFDNYFGFLVETPDAYPNKVAEKFGWNLTQLATSGLRADDIYYLLNYGTENAVEWDDYGNRYMVDKFNNTYFGTDEEVIAQAAAKYQSAIKDADVISINVGSNNFATLMHMRMSYLLGQITGNNFMFGGYDGEFDFNEIVGDLEPEVRADLVKLYEDLKVELFAAAEESGIPTDFVLNEQNGVTLGYVLEDIATAAAYTTAGFAIGYAGILDTIHRENSDAEVIIVELTNWFAGKVFSIPAGEGVLNLQLGDMFDSLYEFASVYMAAVASGYVVSDKINETPAQNIYFAEVEEDVELIIDEIVKNSNIDLEALYEIQDADERFEAALEIAKGISHDVIPDGSVRARLITFLGNYVIANFLGAEAVPTVAQINAIDTYIDHYYSDEFTIDIGYGEMDREKFESVFATFPDCGGVDGCPYGLCQTHIGCALNMYLGLQGVENLVGCIAYLGIEKSMIASLSYNAIEVDDLLLAADFTKLMEASQKALEGHMTSMDDVAAGMIANSELATVSNMLFSFMVGDGAILHPSVAGHQTIADAIVKAYNEKNTATDVTIENLIFVAETLVDYVAENYEEIYADVYAELYEAGVIDALIEELLVAGGELEALYAELEAIKAEADEQYVELIDDLQNEILLTNLTVEKIVDLLRHDTLNAEAYELLNTLCELLVEHAYSINEIIGDVLVIGNAHVETLIENAIIAAELAVEALKAQVNHQLEVLYGELANAADELKQDILDEIERLENQLKADIQRVYDELANQINEINAKYEELKDALNTLAEDTKALIEAVNEFVNYLEENADERVVALAKEAYDALVEATVAAVKKYAPEAADYVYNWLYNNPETVIEFFREYGDEMVDLLKEYHDEIFMVIAYVASNYGEEVLEYVVENADVIIPAVVRWFELNGDNAWALVEVYIDALGISFELDVEFVSPEELLKALGEIAELLCELAEKIADGVIDHLEALNLLDRVNNAVDQLKSQLVEAAEKALDKIVDLSKEQLEALKAEIVENIDEICNKLYSAAEKFVTEELCVYLLAAIEKYAPELAEWAYNWLLENSDKVIEFFREYGDEMVDFLKDNAKEIAQVIAFIVNNYGEEIAEYVLANADVVLAALINWFEIHGNEAWELVKVYLDALKKYVDLDIELGSPEELIKAFNKVVVLLGDLIKLLGNEIYDQLEALDLLGAVEDALAELKAYLLGVAEEKLDELEAHVNAQIEAIKAQINAQIEAVKAEINAQIEAVKAEINAKIEALKAELKNAADEAKEAILGEIARLEAELCAKVAELEALLAAKVAELEAKLAEHVKAELEKLDDYARVLHKLAVDAALELAADVYEAAKNYADMAIRGEFVPTEDSYYVAVNGGVADYADLLAEALGQLGYLDGPVDLGKTTWDDLDYDMLSKADLVTIGYDENELTSFAINQLFAYVTNYVDVDLRNSANAYVDNVFAALQGYIDEEGFVFDLGEFETNATTSLNEIIDVVVLYNLIAGSELQPMDWAGLVGQNNVHYVDEARAALKNEIISAGITETFTYTVDVVEYIYANPEMLGVPELLLAVIPEAKAYEVLGESAYYNIEIPVVDALMFAAESFLYGYLQFNAQYAKLVYDLYTINPDATVVLLGAYNAYDVEMSLGGFSINLGEAYGIVAEATSVHPFIYALLSEKVAYVDISDAETIYEASIAGEDNSLTNFLMTYLFDNSITDVSRAGDQYIFEQILGVLTVGCAHEYSHVCDETCNKCGAVREVPGHVYDGDCDNECNVCGFVREGDFVHQYDGCTDTTCNKCGEIRVAKKHVYDNCIDRFCNVCGLERNDDVYGHDFGYCENTVCKLCGETRPAGEHKFDNCEDLTCYNCSYVRAEGEAHEYDDCADNVCNKCGLSRPAGDHVYANACDATCDRCGETRTVGAHVYSGCTDADCNACGAKREAGVHKVDGCEDNICNVCGQTVGALGHQYGEWKVTVEATKTTDGEKVRECKNCDAKQTLVVGKLGGNVSTGGIVAIVASSAVAASAAGFAIYWFLVQKKTFAQLLAIFTKTATDAAPAAGAAEAAEATAEATAEAAAPNAENK